MSQWLLRDFVVETITAPTKDCSRKPAKADIEAALLIAETTDPTIDEDQPDVIPDACEKRVNREIKERENDENDGMEKDDSPNISESSSSSDSSSDSSSSKRKRVRSGEKKSDAKAAKAKAKTTSKAKAKTTTGSKKQKTHDAAETTPVSRSEPSSSSKAPTEKKRPVAIDTSTLNLFWEFVR